MQQLPLQLKEACGRVGGAGSIAEVDVPVPRVGKGPYAAHRTSGDWPSVEVDFATAVTEVDAAVGKVLESLEATQQAKNTVVFFSSE